MGLPQGDDPGSDLDKIRQKHANRKETKHPEMVPSSSGMFAETIGNKIVWCLRVKGLGAIWMSASAIPDYKDPRGRINFNGCAIFTEDEIRS